MMRELQRNLQSLEHALSLPTLPRVLGRQVLLTTPKAILERKRFDERRTDLLLARMFRRRGHQEIGPHRPSCFNSGKKCSCEKS